LLAGFDQTEASAIDTGLGQQLGLSRGTSREIPRRVINLLGDVVEVSRRAVHQQPDVLDPLAGLDDPGIGSPQATLGPWPIGQDQEVIRLSGIGGMRNALASQ